MRVSVAVLRCRGLHSPRRATARLLVRARTVAALSRVPTFVCASVCALASFVAAGCAARRPALVAIPLPPAPVAAAPLGGNRIAVLAGNERAKAVYIVDMTNSAVVDSFGVAKEATGISAVSREGPLLLSIAVRRAGHSSGTIERWTIDGTLTGTLALPAPALRITQTIDGAAYALVGRGTARNAILVTAWPLRALKPLPLEANADYLQQCRFGQAGSYLVYSTANRRIAAREVATGALLSSKVRAEAPGCIEGRRFIFAIARTARTATIVALSFPGYGQATALPAATSVIALYDATDQHRLAALNSTRTVGALDLFPVEAASVAGHREP